MSTYAYGLAAGLEREPWRLLCQFVGEDDGIMRDLRDIDAIVDCKPPDGLRVGSMKYGEHVLSIPYATLKNMEWKSLSEVRRELRRLVRAGLDEYLSPLLIMRRAQVGE